MASVTLRWGSKSRKVDGVSHTYAGGGLNAHQS